MSSVQDTLGTWESHVELTDEQLKETWHKYRATGDKTLRNLLIEHYLPLVKYNCERLYARLSNEVDIDDVMAAGIDGLRGAVESFDPDRGVQFKTYCLPRIKGAVRDYLRRCDHITRLMRRRARRFECAYHYLRGALGRPPTDDELARHLGFSEGQYMKALRDARMAEVLSIDHGRFDDESGREFRQADAMADARAAMPAAKAQAEDLKRLLTRGLSQVERAVIIMYYYDELTMAEIGAALGMSQSRVSQIHSAAMARLKESLSNRRDEFLARDL